MAAEDVVIIGQGAPVIAFRLPLTLPAVLLQQAFHLGGEVDVAVTGAGLGGLDQNLLAGELHHIPLDVNAAVLVVNVRPLQTAAFSPAHPGGNDQLEVGFIFDAFLFQGSDQLLHRLLVGNGLLLLLTGILVGAPGGIVIQVAALHSVRQNPAQAGVDTLHGAFG